MLFHQSWAPPINRLQKLSAHNLFLNLQWEGLIFILPCCFLMQSCILITSSTGIKPPLSLLILLSLFFRLESSFRSFSRPVLHAAARVVQEMGKSRAAAYFLGYADDESAQQFSYSDHVNSVDSDLNDVSESKGTHLTTCLDILVNSKYISY